ncbi:DUF3667 domain-containing protein [Chitinophaga sp. Hz27]|uniref:DUF3667 domain-containing protein n=1 Tax=Chitinophaga sp. Hz27 TaxID=3347169 RepID=UPI0035D86007
MNCRSCNEVVTEKYCGHCGNPALLKRVDGHYVLHEIQHVLHFEKGILYTVKGLLIRPGKNIRSFLLEDRSRLVKPVIYLVITSLLYTIVAHLLHTEKGHTTPGIAADSAITVMRDWVEHHYGYANMIMSLFIGGWLKLFVRKSGYNFFEILIMLCFVMGTGMLLYTVFVIAEGTTGIKMTLPAEAILLAYSIWAIGQSLAGKPVWKYVSALLAYILGMVSFWTIITLLGLVIDNYHKH